MDAAVVNIAERRQAAEERASHPLGVFGEIADGVKAGTITHDPLEREGHAQGNTQEEKDAKDGERDAMRVLAGKMPLKDLQEVASAAYVRGWQEAVSMLKG